MRRRRRSGRKRASGTGAPIADISLSGGRVARDSDRLIEQSIKPVTVVSDNGTELTSMAILR